MNMRFELKINMNNAAFDDSQELPRILRKVAKQISEGPEYEIWTLLDVNGNTVGNARYIGRKP